MPGVGSDVVVSPMILGLSEHLGVELLLGVVGMGGELCFIIHVFLSHSDMIIWGDILDRFDNCGLSSFAI